MKYRTRDEAFMTQFRHQIMTNTGTEWLADRRWAWRYFQKHLMLDDLHLWANSVAPGFTVPLGAGPLTAEIVVVTPDFLMKDGVGQVQSLLTGTPMESTPVYYTSLRRLAAPEYDRLHDEGYSLNEEGLLAGELSILSPKLIISFGVTQFKGVILEGQDLPVLTSFKDSRLLVLPNLKTVLGDHSVFRDTLQGVNCKDMTFSI